MALWEGMLCPHTLQGKSSRDIFLHVVTPASIPQFTIPSLDIPRQHRASGRGKGQLEGMSWQSSSEPAVEDGHDVPGSCSNTRLAALVQAVPDPIARAALSLPHLPKVTTPYGFITLGQSPQVTSEEVLFLHWGSAYPRDPAPGVHPRWQEEPGCCSRPGTCCWMDGSLSGNKQLSPLATSDKDGGGNQVYRTPARLPLPSKCASPLREIQIRDVLENKEAEKRERRFLGVGYQRSSSSLELPAGTPRKNLFQRILRRHLTHPQQLKPTNFTLH